MALNGKNGLITGACGGLGRAIAEDFLIEGANVVVCDIRKDLVDDFKEKVSPAYPECTLALECDITKDSSLDKMFAEAEKKFGHLDFVINCAGMMDRFDPIVGKAMEKNPPKCEASADSSMWFRETWKSRCGIG